MRFSPLLLDPDEQVLEDVSAKLEDSIGRLRICSHSIVFDPEDFSRPIIRIRFDDFVSVKGKDKDQKLFVGTRCSILCKVGNRSEPYQFVYSEQEFVFLLTFTNPKILLLLLDSLWSAHKLTNRRLRENSINGIIAERRREFAFKLGHLRDHREKLLLAVPNNPSQRAIFVNLVTPLVRCPGLLAVTDSRVYFQPFNSFSESLVEVYELDRIVRVYPRRYCLRAIGLEIYFASEAINRNSSSDDASRISVLSQKESRQAVFFAFENSADRDRVLNLIVRCIGKQFLGGSIDELVHYQKLWRTRRVSNYEYLLFLNDFAGRTVNDITQYPVFPWIISDYDSKELNLDVPAVFRDLSKPIGALNPEKLALLKKRAVECGELDPKMKFLYGTHYSNPAYVLFFLVRLFPDFMLCLQNGRFDEPDRLFHSVSDTWKNCLFNLADVKELIPEFYGYHGHSSKPGDFLNNSRNLDFGTRQNGVKVHDVQLPPWAKDSADFVRKCRSALESEFVSQNLHKWIDLIFGFKNCGEEALKADNLFYYLTYEGSVDIEKIADFDEKVSIEAQIREFGQTPRQIFNDPHPQRISNQMTSDALVDEVSRIVSSEQVSPSKLASYTSPDFEIQVPINELKSLLKNFSPSESHSLPSELSVALQKHVIELSEDLKKQELLAEERLERIDLEFLNRQNEIIRSCEELDNDILMLEGEMNRIQDSIAMSENVVNAASLELKDSQSTLEIHEEMLSKLTRDEPIWNASDESAFLPRSNDVLLLTPIVVIRNIASYLSIPDLARAESVCMQWRSALHNSKVWSNQLKTQGWRYEIEDDSKWFHEHFLVEMRNGERNTCSVLIEEGLVPNSLPDCKNFCFQEKLREQPTLKAELNKKDRQLVMFEVCRLNAAKLEYELQFCTKAIRLHRKGIRLGNSSVKMEKKIQEYTAEIKSYQSEILEGKPILLESSKGLDILNTQVIADNQTLEFLRSRKTRLSGELHTYLSDSSSLKNNFHTLKVLSHHLFFFSH
jgi:hypothetical protein